jgi:hypothetical protein
VTPSSDSDLALIIDFGSQFARRVRELDVRGLPDDPGKRV